MLERRGEAARRCCEPAHQISSMPSTCSAFLAKSFCALFVGSVNSSSMISVRIWRHHKDTSEQVTAAEHAMRPDCGRGAYPFTLLEQICVRRKLRENHHEKKEGWRVQHQVVEVLQQHEHHTTASELNGRPVAPASRRKRVVESSAHGGAPLPGLIHVHGQHAQLPPPRPAFQTVAQLGGGMAE